MRGVDPKAAKAAAADKGDEKTADKPGEDDPLPNRDDADEEE